MEGKTKQRGRAYSSTHRLPGLVDDGTARQPQQQQLPSSSLSHVNMPWHSFEPIITSLLDGSPLAIAITALIAFGLPILLHLVFYKSVASPPSRNFLLLGPSGAGKTALLSLVRVPTGILCERLTLKL